MFSYLIHLPPLPPFVDYHELDFIYFVLEGKYGGGLCGNGQVFFVVGRHKWIYNSLLLCEGLSYIIHVFIHF